MQDDFTDSMFFALGSMMHTETTPITIVDEQGIAKQAWSHTFIPAPGPRVVGSVFISGTDQYGNEVIENIPLIGLRFKELSKLRKLARLRKIKRRQRRAAQRKRYRGKA